MGGLTFLIMFLILMAMLSVIPQFLRRYYIPAVVSMIIIGIIIGPNALDLIGKMNVFLGRGYPTAQLHGILEAMGLLGLVFLMALAGMEVDLRIIRAERFAVFWLSFLTFTIPAIAGYFVYDWFMPDDTIGKWVYASLFASHSVGIVFPVIREMNVVHSRFGIAVLASTVITDIASLVLFGLCIQFKRHEIPGRVAGSISIFDHVNLDALGSFFPVIFIFSILFFMFLVMSLAPIIAKRILGRISPNDDSRITFFLFGVLIVVFIGEVIGVSLIVGAFIAGMAIVRSPGFHEHSRLLHKKIEGVGYGILIPFLFLTIGMKTDMKILFSAWQNAAIVGATCAGLIISKVLSGWIALRISGFNNRKAFLAGLITVPQLSATIAAAAVALQLNMISADFFNAIICLSLVTTIPVPPLVKILVHRWNVSFDKIAPRYQRMISDAGTGEETL